MTDHYYYNIIIYILGSSSSSGASYSKNKARGGKINRPGKDARTKKRTASK